MATILLQNLLIEVFSGFCYVSHSLMIILPYPHLYADDSTLNFSCLFRDDLTQIKDERRL